MLVIVVDVATPNDEETVTALRRSGYAKREVWIKSVDKGEAPYEGAVIRTLGVGRYVVAEPWGRGPE